jgi:hypothetical protein
LSLLARKRLTILDYAEMRLREQRYTATYGPGEVQAHLERINRAREIYEQLLHSR